MAKTILEFIRRKIKTVRHMIITIDLRMWSSSGIGKVLQNTIPSFIRNFSNINFILLGNKEILDKLDWPINVVEIRKFDAKIYSLSEQIDAIKIIPKNTDLLWWPHWNIPLFYRGKLVTSIYDAFHLRIPWSVKNLLKNVYTRLLFYFLAKKSSMTLTISKFSKNELIELTQIDSSNIHIVYPSVDQEWHEPIPKNNSKSYPYIIYVGNVKPHKDLITLIKAFIKNSKLIKHKLIIIGKEEGFISGDKDVKSYANNHSDKIIFTGWLDDTLVREYVFNADLMVFPSNYEGFGIPPLEAMACGCPVIASDIPVIREVCSESVMYFRSGDIDDLSIKISELINNKELQESLISKGFNLVKKYNWNKSIKEINDKFANLLTQKNK